MPEGFGKLLDTIAALGFATAMNVSGVNIVRIEQQRDFALVNWAAPAAEIYPFVARVSIEQSLHLRKRTTSGVLRGLISGLWLALTGLRALNGRAGWSYGSAGCEIPGRATDQACTFAALRRAKCALAGASPPQGGLP